MKTSIGDLRKRAAKRAAAKGRRGVVLVTGAAGKVGNILVSALLERNCTVRALVRKAADAEKLPGGAEVFIGDITKPGTLKGCCRDVDVVFHLAALLDPWRGRDALQAANVGGTASIVKEAHGAGVRRFVYASTLGVYGKANAGRLLRREDAGAPGSSYGATKLLGEDEVRRGGVEFVILRLGIVYGPGFAAGMAPMLRMLDRRLTPCIGSGKNRIPFVHVDDVVRAFLLASKKREAAGGTYNVVGRPLTQEEAFRIACKFLGVPAPGLHVPRILVMSGIRLLNSVRGLLGKKPAIMPEYVDALSLDRAFEMDRERAELGWGPEVDSEKGMAQMVRWYREERKDA